MCRKTKRTTPCSSVEVLLSTVTVLLFTVCIGLIVVTSLALQSGNEGQTGSSNSSFSGTLTISEGASFTEELRNRSSVHFKALAFDTELLIADAYELSSLNTQFRSCRVTDFSQGSVVVHFTLLFEDVVGVTTVQEQLISGLQNIPDSTLVINSSSIHVTDTSTTQTPPTTTPEPVACPNGQRLCRDNVTCVPTTHFCDGVANCPDASDESHSTCATVCDGQFLLLGPSGSFHSDNFPQDYDSGTVCRWIIRVDEGLSIKIDFVTFDTEQEFDVLNVYEGTGTAKTLLYSLSGSSPGIVWIISHEATVMFVSDVMNNQRGFNATYQAENLTHLSNEVKINCSFEEGFCFWRHDLDGDGEWMRKNGTSFPFLNGPSFDHTFANESGYYIITPVSPGSWEKIFRLRSLPLDPAAEAMCLRFWYHMYGEEARSLRVSAERDSNVTLLFQKEGNYGNNWNYGQITINDTTNQTIVFEARKTGGTRNNIALDDLSMTSGPCGPAPPDPTTVPVLTTPPPGPADCGGPFDLYEPNTTFSSPNYPHGYRPGASCLWILHAKPGQNIQLHFQDFSLEVGYDVVEVRNGVEPHSTLLSVLTGERHFPDLFSTTSEMTVMFFSDSSGSDRGFLANFSTGFNLGQPEACQADEYQCRSGVCVAAASVCDGVSNCPDASDEANCVHLTGADFPGAPRLKIEIQRRLYTACSSDWSSHASGYFCRYLGYRSGNASFVSALGEEAPFVIVSQAADGSVDVKPSEKCPSEKVVSLHCDNQPCGKRKVVINTESGSSGRETSEGVEGRIVGGEDAVKGAWPWIASLRWTGRSVCGATLIDSQWLVTAAHCVYGKNIHLSNWNVILGLHAQYESDTSDRQNHKIDQIIMNQNYNKRTKDSDIALIHLQNKVNFTDYIQPICLPESDQQFAAGRKCVIAGWGTLTEGGVVADVLQQAVLPLINNSECQARLPEYNITERMVCAGYPEGGIDTCQGDSGGPLMCEEDGFWVLVGVTSFGVGCARPGRPGVYALLSQFTDWILETRRLYAHWDGAR
ncbi:enteropeptidase isoform X1 [Pangasianodon hypophthalmus]|uniref:enteropeptidase isoform X1 n=1 Tax=Pangasianodon hypophthalmus TaxID=310915 RepID=UPI002307A94A|nr:enteropeptidase isoform X1 [Pangasianodon hypophthalmus]